MQELSEAVQNLCASVTSVSWTSVARTGIGHTFLNGSNFGEVPFLIPEIIPYDAKEVLVVAVAQVGNTKPVNQAHLIKIYTRQNSEQYEKYIYIVPYPQNALVTNTENLWFPMTFSRIIYIDVQNIIIQGNSFIALDAIGYR